MKLKMRIPFYLKMSNLYNTNISKNQHRSILTKGPSDDSKQSEGKRRGER